VLATSETGLRKLIRLLAALETAVCNHADLEPQLTELHPLAESLRVRRVLWRFWRGILACKSYDDEEMSSCLVAAGASIAGLEEREEYRELRIGDRIQLRDLHERIRDWLCTSGASLADAQRLWQDLHGCAMLLREVNLRSELIDHDRKVVTECMAELDGLGPGAPCPPAVCRRLDAIRGRSDRLDDLIVDNPAPSAERVRAILIRVDSALGRDARETSGGPPGGGGSVVPMPR
jgi:hypothetical protein